MYASIFGENEENDRRIWNDALQAAVLALACDEPDPMRPDVLIDADPCGDCEKKDCARELTIRRLLELKRPAPSKLSDSLIHYLRRQALSSSRAHCPAGEPE
jgi:hypothetical protein